MKNSVYSLFAIFGILACSCGNTENDKLELFFSDSTDVVEIQLHKISGDTILYYRIWEIPGRSTIMVHEGRVGLKGEHYEVFKESKQELIDFANVECSKRSKQNYVITEPVDYITMIVQFDTTAIEWRDEESLIVLNDLIHNSLTTTGNGGCSNHDVGTSGINFFITVLDQQAAKNVLINDIEKEMGFLPQIIATEVGELITIIYPENFEGDFSYL